jgi:signal transduction histidine kinase/ActR/RegA family two-component response regulator
MGRADEGLFDARSWMPALEKYGAVTHLTVTLYGADGRIVVGPEPSTPLFAAFEQHGFDPGVFAECARRCLAQAGDRPPVVVAPPSGLAVVGTSLLLEGEVVGAAVAGYALVDFAQSPVIARLARQAGVPFSRLWELARKQQPVPQRRLVLHGELLQVLGDTILRENHRTRLYEDTAARLAKEMASKDEFLAIVSHELRTPLSPILAWARILKAEDPGRNRNALDSIERNVLLQMRLVDDLLDMNRVIRDNVSLELAVHDLGDLARSALDTIAEAAALKRIDLTLTGISGPLPVEGDAGRLQQVFLNVLSNAVKFTPAGGRVQVTASREADAVVVKITDTGEGIAPVFLPHAFDMFRQQEEGTQRRHSGLGIGLAVVKRLVELHRGQVQLASGSAGVGTEVTIRLPLAPPGAAAPAGTAATDLRQRPLDRLTILVVEDVEDALEATRMMLALLGAKVLTAGDGREALELIASSRPDLVLCDLRMPRMDGFEFLRELSRRQGEDRPPVVAMSGLVSDADHGRTEAAGFDGNLDKPFDDVQLVSAVRATLGHRRTA